MRRFGIVSKPPQTLAGKKQAAGGARIAPAACIEDAEATAVWGQAPAGGARIAPAAGPFRAAPYPLSLAIPHKAAGDIQKRVARYPNKCIISVTDFIVSATDFERGCHVRATYPRPWARSPCAATATHCAACG